MVNRKGWQLSDNSEQRISACFTLPYHIDNKSNNLAAVVYLKLIKEMVSSQQTTPTPHPLGNLSVSKNNDNCHC